MSREFIHKPLETLNDAKAFIEALAMEGLLFHFEDDIHDIVWAERTKAPSIEELSQLDLRRDELYAFEWGSFGCPIGYANHIQG